MKAGQSKRRSFATTIFIAGVLSSLLALSAATKGFSGSSQWLTPAFIVVSLCLFIALFTVYTYLSQRENKQADTLSNLQKRMDQYLAQVGQKKEQTVELKTTISAKDFSKKIIPDLTIDFDSVEKLTEHILNAIAKEFSVAQGLFFVRNVNNDQFELQGRYAYFSEEKVHDFKEGEGLSGQVAKSQNVLNVADIPEGYITILSGLGKGYPKHLIVIPTIWNGTSNGIIELASFTEFSQEMVNLFSEMRMQIGERIHLFMNKEVN